MVVWDHPSNPDGNSARFIDLGYTLDEIDALLMNRDNLTSLIRDPDFTGLGGITYGRTASGKSIGVIWEAECGNPLHIYPLRVIPG